MGLRKNWQVNLIQRILQSKSFEQLTDEVKNPSNGVEHIKVQEDRGVTHKDYHCYSSCAEVLAEFGMRKPLSIVQLIDGTFGSVVRRGKVVVINRVSDTTDIVGDLRYFRWTTIDDEGDYTERTIHHSDIVVTGLLLPLLDKGGLGCDPQGRPYAAVDSLWRENAR